MKRYIDVYSASSVIGFSSEDLQQISNLYDQAEQSWANTTKNLLLCRNESCHSLLPGLTRQIDSYFSFLSNVSELAHSKWTEFNLNLMGIGLGTMLMSLFLIFRAIQWVHAPYKSLLLSPEDSGISFEFIFAFFVVAIRACSFLSNSYICKF